MTIYEKAILDTIAYAEGTLGVSQNGYDVLVTFPIIIGWSENTDIRHRCVKPTGNLTAQIIKDKGGTVCTDSPVKTGPSWFRVVNESKGVNSTAAGRYQFLGSSWATTTEKLGLGFNAPMTKDNQDKAALRAVKTKRKVTETELKNAYSSFSSFEVVRKKLENEWTSLKLNRTSSTSGDKTPSKYWEVYKYAVKVYKNGPQSGTNGTSKGKSNKIFSNKVIFMGGLDNRSGDLSLSEQTTLLKQGLGGGVSVSSFRYTNLSDVLNEIDATPDAYVVLFSAGASNAKKVAEKLKDRDGSLGGLYIVEPYGVSTNTKNSVIGAVGLGTPSKNVLVGTYEAAGLNIVQGTTPSNCSSPVGSHWCAINVVGGVIQGIRNSYTS